MRAPRRQIGLLGIIIFLAGAVGCDKNSIVVDRAAGISGTITNDMPYADAKKLLMDARAKERVGWNTEGTGPISNRRFDLADGSPFELSVEKATERIKTIKYCDAATVKRRRDTWRWRTLVVYQMENTEKKDSQPGAGR
jgi:hypothetical protein